MGIKLLLFIPLLIAAIQVIAFLGTLLQAGRRFSFSSILATEKKYPALKNLRHPGLWISIVLGMVFPALWSDVVAWQRSAITTLPEVPISAIAAGAAEGKICALDGYPSTLLIGVRRSYITATPCDGAKPVHASMTIRVKKGGEQRVAQAMYQELQRLFNIELATLQQRDSALGREPRQATMPALRIHPQPFALQAIDLVVVLVLLGLVGLGTAFGSMVLILTLLVRVVRDGILPRLTQGSRKLVCLTPANPPPFQVDRDQAFLRTLVADLEAREPRDSFVDYLLRELKDTAKGPDQRAVIAKAALVTLQRDTAAHWNAPREPQETGPQDDRSALLRTQLPASARIVGDGETPLSEEQSRTLLRRGLGPLIGWLVIGAILIAGSPSTLPAIILVSIITLGFLFRAHIYLKDRSLGVTRVVEGDILLPAYSSKEDAFYFTLGDVDRFEVDLDTFARIQHARRCRVTYSPNTRLLWKIEPLG